jgi:uncharacterized membrane protein YdjX (TVP38/TMEM64 family)
MAERIADAQTHQGSTPATLRRHLMTTGLAVVAMLLVAATWRWGPLADFDISTVLSGAAAIFENPILAIAAIAACFVLGSLVFAPLVAMVVAAGLLFDPATAFCGAFAGALLAAVTGYGIGNALGRQPMWRLAGSRVERVSRIFSRHGVLTVVVARNLPLAPFTLVNMIAGASHISFRSFALGSALGMAPGIFVMTILADRFRAFLLNPDLFNLTIFGLLVAALALAGAWVWWRFGGTRRVRE